jgi:succinyl-CoA synthetase beta subunit
MNIHEYQGKSILKSFGVTIQEGIVAETPEQAVTAAKQLMETHKCDGVVIKAQIHAGGRGKGGGVKFAPNIDKVKEIATNIIGMHLITPQTSATGKLVSKVLVAQDVYYGKKEDIKEFYMSVLLDRAKGRNTFVYSTEGGMDIEHVAEHTPEKIWKEEIDPRVGLQAFQARKIAFNLGLGGNAFKEMTKFIASLYKAYDSIDASLFEINPVLKTSDDKIIAVDSKVSFDDNGLFRHPKYEAMRDVSEENPIDVEAREAELNYVQLEGNVGCMVNGAGLAMATMDIIKLSGGEPANFLDVGGSANAERVEKAFRIILKDKNVKAILVNIFGGIVRCDRVAQGVVDAYKNMGNIEVPIIVRLQGTNADIAKKLIDDSGLKVYSATEFHEAASLVNKLIKGN